MGEINSFGSAEGKMADVCRGLGKERGRVARVRREGGIGGEEGERERREREVGAGGEG